MSINANTNRTYTKAYGTPGSKTASKPAGTIVPSANRRMGGRLVVLLLAEQRRGWSLMIFCARATRGLRRPSLDGCK